MKLPNEGRLRTSAQWAALLAGTGAVVGAAFGQDSGTPAAGSDSAVELDKMSVTGSRIRRVDSETASPVFVIDRATIENSGVTTLGELLTDLPSVSGAATNPRVNNGGGTGATVASLRGLGEQRTLVLLNGRRITPFTNGVAEGVDVNAIPINLVERVEILKEGASAIYGSDAIGGVVNFITRREYNGAEASYEYGISGEDDGERQAVELSWGSSSQKSSIMLGLNYNKQKGVSAGDRKFSSQALYLYGGVVTAGGSSRTPTGRINLPANILGNYAGAGCDGANSVTRIDGATGSALSDFRCFQVPTDFYNYQPLNLILTPQERVNLFTVSSYQITDKVEAYAELFLNNSKSNSQLAALPLDTRNDNVVISADSIYNPFGIDFGGLGTGNQNAQFRLTALGNRVQSYETTTGQINLGFRGDLPFVESWKWDAGGSFGRNQQRQDVTGYLFTTNLNDAFGPSFIDGDGAARCGSANAIVAGCTPLNVFNLELALTDPLQAAQFASAAARYDTVTTRNQQIATVNLNGPLFQLPGGMSQLAVGFEYRKQNVSNQVDSLAQLQAPDFVSCRLPQETCTNATEGSIYARELYAELFLPIVADQPFMKALNLIVGARYSNYGDLGDPTNGKIALEYKPVDDLLIRGSYAEVFRAPTITDQYLAITADAPTFTDPCTGLTQVQLDENPNLAAACEFVPTDGSFDGSNGQITGRRRGNTELKPETGDVITYGVVYDASWLKGFSTTVDFWRYKLKNTIELVDVNTTANICAQTGNEEFCGLIVRDASDGQVVYIDEPVLNLGKIDMRGVDVGFKYRLPMTPVGKFLLSLDSTYFDKFERTAPGTPPSSVAGQFSRQDGNFARIRSLGSVTWSYSNWESLISWRYVHGFKLPDADGNPVDNNGDDVPDQIELDIGSHSYFDATVGYNIPGTGAKLLVGVENAFDRQPPYLYQNNTSNANTDVETFDTVGRFFFGRVSVKF